ncbi:MAG: hypothetical protein IRZ00_03245 [Gemmatimonadetes bacterium]|nr:hypothetical protein [Gemmatimonadota bacterium]
MLRSRPIRRALLTLGLVLAQLAGGTIAAAAGMTGEHVAPAPVKQCQATPAHEAGAHHHDRGARPASSPCAELPCTGCATPACAVAPGCAPAPASAAPIPVLQLPATLDVPLPAAVRAAHAAPSLPESPPPRA